MEVTILQSRGTIRVKSPYNSEFVADAKGLGGRWDGDAWHFDDRNNARVRARCLEYFGTDGSTQVEMVTVHVECADYGGDQSIVVYGRSIAKRHDRDGAVKLYEGCSIVDGSFKSRGGSVKNPIINTNNAIIEVFDVPRARADECGYTVTIVESTAGKRTSLQAEEKRLVARLTEIRAELKKGNVTMDRSFEDQGKIYTVYSDGTSDFPGNFELRGSSIFILHSQGGVSAEYPLHEIKAKVNGKKKTKKKASKKKAKKSA